MIDERAIAACVRAASYRTPLIKRAAARAAHGPKSAARHQLGEAVRHAEELVAELKTQQLVLGWKDEDAA